MTTTWWIEPCLWDDDESLPDWEFPEPEPERGVEDVVVVGDVL